MRSFDEAARVIRERGAPIVVKADGLCAGKGVVVATTVDEALAAAKDMLVDRRFGDAGATVILEDAIQGEEASVHAISDGEAIFVLPPARDHKRVGERRHRAQHRRHGRVRAERPRHPGPDRARRARDPPADDRGHAGGGGPSAGCCSRA